VSRGTVSTQGFADTVDIVPPEAREGTWDPAPGRRAGALGDSVDVRVPLIPYTLHRQKAREGTCGGWGAELKTLGYSRVEIRWKVGTSSGWRW
jgi:hypothetical protein